MEMELLRGSNELSNEKLGAQWWDTTKGSVVQELSACMTS
jgi:hypothetical protein